MKFFLKKKFIIGGCFSALAIFDIFANVLSGMINPKLMIVGILMLVIGINTIYNVMVLKKSGIEIADIESADAKANSVVLLVLQVLLSIAVAVTAIVNIFVESYRVVFLALIITFGSLLLFSYMLESVLIRYFARK